MWWCWSCYISQWRSLKETFSNSFGKIGWLLSRRCWPIHYGHWASSVNCKTFKPCRKNSQWYWFSRGKLNSKFKINFCVWIFNTFFLFVKINEAFGAQTLACQKELKLDIEKLNVNGGAIAIGHPLAASGARITSHLVHELKWVFITFHYFLKYMHYFVSL